jgi:hypothetical protein
MGSITSVLVSLGYRALQSCDVDAALQKFSAFHGPELEPKSVIQSDIVAQYGGSTTGLEALWDVACLTDDVLCRINCPGLLINSTPLL